MTPTQTHIITTVASILFVALLLPIEPAALANGFQSVEAKPTQESEFDARRREAASINPQDVSFSIRLEGDKKQFRQGEVIRLEMRFASSRAKAYRMDAATYDRSGRIEMDKFHIEPETGFTDPMRDHLGFLGGGLRGFPELEEKPYLITYEINEWFRFDRPGKYRLYLTSPRVSRIGKQEESGAVTLTSNAVEFEIVEAEVSWQDKELQRIVKELDAKDQKTDRRAACRALRFLGSKAAVPELVRRYDDSDQECAFEYYAGLIGSPHRDFAIETMEAQIAAPNQPISGGWLNLLIQLVAAPQLRPPASGDEQQWSEYWQRRKGLYEQNQAKYGGQLAQAIPLKTGRAKAVSVNTLLEIKWDKTKLPDVATIFNELPLQQQRTLLEYRWKQIADESLLPTLRRLYQKQSDVDPERSYEVAEINALALKRIYELSPDEGRRLILATMKRPKPGVSLRALTVLPDETLPELDQTFVDNFEKGGRTEVHSALIERYGSPGIYARVRSLLEGKIGKMACYEQDHLLAYILRVDPSAGIELIRQALAARGKEDSHCYPSVLASVAELHMSPELEKLALESLDDADVEVAISAVAVLGKYASADAEEPLWQRLEKWHREWGGREQELKADLRDNEPIRLQTGLEHALRMALSQSPAWLADVKKLERIKQLCVTQSEREQVDHSIAEWGHEVGIRFAPAEDDWGRVSVAQYELQSPSALKQKLSQFPQGTVFKWQPYNEGSFGEEKEKLFRELDSFLRERGLKIVK